MDNKVHAYWENFLLETNRAKETKCFEVFYFGSTEKSANYLLKLVLQGRKTATASSIYQYKLTDSNYPKVGDLSIVTDYNGNPKCIIETRETLQLKFSDMTYDICKREGEDDTLESWQQKHIEFFTKIGEELGFEFSFDMDIIFEDFGVVYK
ncbi:ASCH domain-containing protein [Ornithinibacillus sp. 4-3]|uniref:ASCH domain-containing protein n=1 Tax=Ornithinibacillus sp. 4-3 TaxID=3231488 RepID=A0AB39HK62_9BACI